MSIKDRVTIPFVALFGALVIALALSAYLWARDDAYSKLDAELQVATGATAMSAGHELSEHARQGAGEKDLQAVLNDVGGSDLTATQILVRERDREVAYKSGASAKDLRSVAVDQLKNGATVAGLRIATRTLALPKFNTAFQIYAAQPVSPALAEIGRLRSRLFVMVPIGLALAALGGYLLATKALSPLKQLVETIDSVTSSDLSARVEASERKDEIGKLGSRFNSLLGSIEDAFALQRRFMADASHQIRTPVGIALTASQVMNREPHATLIDCQESLQVIENQMLQLRRVVEDMFFLSQADTASLKFRQKEMFLDDAVTEAVRSAGTLATAKQQTLRLKSLPEAKCLGDDDLLKQAILILLDNAIKYTPAAGTIEVSLEERGDQWVCTVSDDGKGISEAARGRVFERFFREEGSGAGAGLGLAIAKSIVEKHGGTLTLVESRPGRTSFAAAIPAFQKTAADAIQANSFAVRI